MYSPQEIGVWSRFGGYAETTLGRDQWIAAFRDRAVLSGWALRELESHFDFQTAAGPDPNPASVFMNCPLNNQFSWSIIDNNTMRNVYIVDKYKPPPSTAMQCILAGTVKSGITSVGYVEHGEGNQTGDAIFAAILTGLQMLGYDPRVTGTRMARLFSGMITNTDPQITFGGRLLTTYGPSPFQNGSWKRGGVVLRSQASKKKIYKGGTAVEYGHGNDLEICVMQTRVLTGNVLVALAAKRFIEFPWEQPAPPPPPGGGITYDASADVYRTIQRSPKVFSPWVFYGNPYTILSYHDTSVASDHAFIQAAALKLLDTRYLDTQDLPFEEATLAAIEAGGVGGRAASCDYQGSLLIKNRVALKSPYGYNKVRYSEGGANAAAIQLYSYLPGRIGGAGSPLVTADGPWVGGFREGSECWCGWGMGDVESGPNASPTIVAGSVWDSFVLHENTADPVNSPLFLHDGKMFKKWTKTSPFPDGNQSQFTLCVRVTQVL